MSRPATSAMRMTAAAETSGTVQARNFTDVRIRGLELSLDAPVVTRYGVLGLTGSAAFTHGQIGADRPFPGAGQYRGHIEGLYLCGSSSHPGGNITGLPGYNCAQVLHADLGLKATWHA